MLEIGCFSILMSGGSEIGGEDANTKTKTCKGAFLIIVSFIPPRKVTLPITYKNQGFSKADPQKSGYVII